MQKAFNILYSKWKTTFIIIHQLWDTLYELDIWNYQWEKSFCAHTIDGQKVKAEKDENWSQ